jgi:hypothetical protein
LVAGIDLLRPSPPPPRAAPTDRERCCSEGGVRPAARWPASVRSRKPSCAVSVASASVCGVLFFPLAVRGDFVWFARDGVGDSDFADLAFAARFRCSGMR